MTTNHASAPQPPPTQGVTPVYRLVMADILALVDAGQQKYGTTLNTHNGRSAKWDAYQEIIDLTLYMRQDIAERDDEITFLRQWLRNTLETDDEFINTVFANWLRQKKSYEQIHSQA